MLDAAGVQRACLLGNSMGGHVALDLALAHPDRVAGLVLIGSGVGGAPSPAPATDGTAWLYAALETTENAHDLDELGRLEAHLLLDGPDAPEGRVRDPVRGLFLEMNGRALAAADPGERTAPGSAWERLAEIASPRLVMVGALDLERFHANAHAIAQRVPGATRVVLEGVAHVPVLEGDPVTVRRIAEFVDRLVSRCESPSGSAVRPRASSTPPIGEHAAGPAPARDDHCAGQRPTGASRDRRRAVVPIPVVRSPSRGEERPMGSRLRDPPTTRLEIAQ